jgi:hypothetical protein
MALAFNRLSRLFIPDSLCLPGFLKESKWEKHQGKKNVFPLKHKMKNWFTAFGFDRQIIL